MKRILLGLLFLIPSITFAADNTVILTPGTGVTMRTQDTGSGVQAPYNILSTISGNTIYGTAGSSNSVVLSVQGITSGTPLIISSNTLGTSGDTICASATGNCTTQALIKYLNNAVISSIPAGSAIIGKISIDQTTPGTTNNVAVSYGSTALVADPCQSNTATISPISITTATTTKIANAVSAKKLYICYMLLSSVAADVVSIVEGTGSTCGTNQAGVVGGISPNSLAFASNGGVAMGSGGFSVAATAGTNVDFCIQTSVATPLSGVLKAVYAP